MPSNWHYDEQDDYYIDHQGGRFNFKHYSTRRDRYGYRRITLELRRRGLIVNHKKVQCLMRKHLALNGLVFHTDQGWQYQHQQFQSWLKNHGIDQSMSRKGNSLDDRLMEGFWHHEARNVLRL